MLIVVDLSSEATDGLTSCSSRKLSKDPDQLAAASTSDTSRANTSSRRLPSHPGIQIVSSINRNFPPSSSISSTLAPMYPPRRWRGGTTRTCLILLASTLWRRNHPRQCIPKGSTSTRAHIPLRTTGIVERNIPAITPKIQTRSPSNVNNLARDAANASSTKPSKVTTINLKKFDQYAIFTASAISSTRDSATNLERSQASGCSELLRPAVPHANPSKIFFTSTEPLSAAIVLPKILAFAIQVERSNRPDQVHQVRPPHLVPIMIQNRFPARQS